MTTRREWRRQRAYSNEWDLLEDDNETGFGDENSRRNVTERKSIGGVGGLRRGRQNKPGNHLHPFFNLLTSISPAFCNRGSISPTLAQFHPRSMHSFYVCELRAQLFWCLHFRFVLYWRKTVSANLRVEHWWNWTQVSISPTFYVRLFCTKVSHKAFLYLHFRIDLFLAKNIGANALAHKTLMKLTTAF